MGVKVIFECGGCFAKAEGTAQLHAPFVSVSGKPYGFGSRREELASSVTPEGWVAFDPYTACTYCPACWEGIMAEDESPSPQVAGEE